MNLLDPLDLPDVRQRRLVRVAAIDVGADWTAHLDRAGLLVATSADFRVFAADGGDRHVRHGGQLALRHDAGPTVAVRDDVIIVLQADRVAAFDRRRGAWSRGFEFGAAGHASCAVTADGTLWLVTQHGEEVTLATFAAGELAGPSAQVALEQARGEDGWWSVSPGPPRAAEVEVSAGMGQDGSLTARARWVRGEGIVVEDVERDVSLLGWSPSGAATAYLGHHDGLLEVRHAGARHPLDLSELFEEIDDGHNWRGQLLDDRRVLLPTSEGRILEIDVVDGSVTELLLDGDARNWDWALVARVGDRLITARHRDRELPAWDAGVGGNAPGDTAPARG